MIGRIDVHHHLLTPRLIEELSSVGINYAGGSALPSWKPQDSLAMMDRHGIDAALLSMPVPLQFSDQAHTRDLARSLNEFGAECVARWPQRFGLFATLPLPDVEAALAEIAYAFDTLGADGVGLLSNHAGVYLGDPRLEPVVAELDRRGAVAFVHPTVFTSGEIPTAPNAGSPIPTIEPSLLEFIFDTTRTVASLVISGTLKRYTRVRFILSHAGGTIPYVHDRILDRSEILALVRRAQAGEVPPPSPQTYQRLMRDALADARSQLQGLYYDTTFSANPTVFGCLRQLAPATHILLGTDFPFGQEVGVHLNIDGLEQLTKSEERQVMERDNALALFPHLQPHTA